MPGEQENAASGSAGHLIILEAVVGCHFPSVLARIPRKHAKLGQVTTEADEHLKNNSTPLRLRHLRKSDCEIPHANFAQTSHDGVGSDSDGDSQSARNGSRQRSESS